MFRVVTGRQEATPLQTSFFRAGHAHAGVFLVLGLITQVLVDATTLSGLTEWVARSFVPAAALLLPGGFFLSVTSRGATKPNRLVLLVPLGAVVLAIGLAHPRHRAADRMTSPRERLLQAGPRRRRHRRPRGPHPAGDRPASRRVARRATAALPDARRRSSPRWRPKASRS